MILGATSTYTHAKWPTNHTIPLPSPDIFISSEGENTEEDRRNSIFPPKQYIHSPYSSLSPSLPPSLSCEIWLDTAIHRSFYLPPSRSSTLRLLCPSVCLFQISSPGDRVSVVAERISTLTQVRRQSAPPLTRSATHRCYHSIQRSQSCRQNRYCQNRVRVQGANFRHTRADGSGSDSSQRTKCSTKQTKAHLLGSCS